MFEFYRFRVDWDLFGNPKTDMLEITKNHYKTISDQLHYEVLPNEELVNMLGMTFLYSYKQPKRALELLKMNAENYPENYGVYDSLGEVYLTLNKKEKAAQEFKKSLELNPDSPSKEKLKKLIKE